jgi:hypothetical protein
MADLNPLTADELLGMLDKPKQDQAAPAAPSQAPAGKISSEELTGMIDKPKPLPGTEGVPGVWEDIGRTALAKVPRGIAAIPGMAGDIASLTGTPNKYLPTTEDIIRRAGSIDPAVEKALAYKPVHGVSRYLGSAAEFLPSALIPGGQAGLATRAAGAVGSGLGMQAVEDFLKKTPAEGTGYELAGKLAGALAGGAGATRLASGIGSNLRGVVAPEKEALSQIAGAVGSDITRGGDKGARATIQQATEAGLPLGAIGGQATERLIQKSAGSAGVEAQGAYNTAVQDFKSTALNKEAPGSIHRQIDDIFGRPVDAFEEINNLNQRRRELNDINYTRVMSLPEAQAIVHPGLEAAFNRIDPEAFKSVMTSLRRNNIAPESLGLVKTADNVYEIPKTGASLKFWDELKQAIDDQIGSYYSEVTKQIKPGGEGTVRDLMGVKTALVNSLDDAVKDYKKIRFEGSELYNSRNAIEAGRKFFSDNDPKKINAAKKYVADKLGPNHQDEFAYGMASAYKDFLEKDPMAALGVYRGKNATLTQDKLRFALGDDRANELIGAANNAYLNSTIKQIPDLRVDSGLKSAATKGALAGIASEVGLVGENMLQALSFNMAPTAIMGAIAGAAGKALYNWKDQRVGEQLLKIMADPARTKEVGEMIANNPEARSFLAKTYSVISKTAPSTESTARTERASGGRIVHNSKADALVRAAEMAKKDISKGTEALLDQPDETITRALAVAKKHI